MDCTYFRTLGSVIIDNEATENEIKEFNDHIAQCDECSKWFETIKILKSETENLTEEVPPELKSRVMNYVKNGDKKPSFFSRFRFTAVAAAVALIVFAVNGFTFPAPEEVPQTVNTPTVASRMAPVPDKILAGENIETPENIYDRAFSYVVYITDAAVAEILKDMDFEAKDGYKYYITDMKYDAFASYSQEIIALNLSLDTEGLVIVKE